MRQKSNYERIQEAGAAYVLADKDQWKLLIQQRGIDNAIEAIQRCAADAKEPKISNVWKYLSEEKVPQEAPMSTVDASGTKDQLRANYLANAEAREELPELRRRLEGVDLSEATTTLRACVKQVMNNDQAGHLAVSHVRKWLDAL